MTPQLCKGFAATRGKPCHCGSRVAGIRSGIKKEPADSKPLPPASVENIAIDVSGRVETLEAHHHTG